MNSSVEVNGGKGVRGREPATGYTDTTTITSPDFTQLAESLPEMIPATELPRLLGGIYSAKYFANLRWMGKGPRSFKLGHKVLYLREDIIVWLKEEVRAFVPSDVAA